LNIHIHQLSGKDQIPDSICKPCKVELNMAFQFREKALRKQAEIEHYCRELGLLDDSEDYIVKEELGSHQQVEDDEMNDFVMNEAACDGDDGSQNDEYVEVDGSHEQEVHSDDIEYLEDNYTIDMNPEHDDAVLETKYDDEAQASSEIKLRRGRTRLGMGAVKSEHEEMQQSFDLKEEVAQVKPRRGRARPGLNSLRTSNGTEKGGYVCDVCGNFYEKRGRMMEHRRRHDTVCQYQCE